MNDPADRPAPPPRRRWRRGSPTPDVNPDLRNAAVFTDSHVEIEIDEATGKPQLRIVSGARPKE